MRDIEVTRRNTRGDIVIPARLVKAFKKDAYVVVLRDDNRIIVEEVVNPDQLEEDLEFARRTEEAWQRIEKGEYVQMDMDDFLRELRTW